MSENMIPKVKQGFYLMGPSEGALVRVNGRAEFKVFLIPKTLREKANCRIYFDKEHVAEGKMDVEGCMLLVLAYGRYFYEPASFVKLEDHYALRLDRYFAGKSYKTPEMRFESLYFRTAAFVSRHSRKGKHICKYLTLVQPGEGGFAFLSEESWCIVLDKDRLLFPSRRCRVIFYGEESDQIRGYGPYMLATVAERIIGTNKKMRFEEYEREAETLQEVYDMCTDYYDEYTEEKLERYEELHREYQFDKLFAKLKEREKDTEEEIRERFEMLEEMGLSIEFEKRFISEKKIPYNVGFTGRWNSDGIRDKRIQNFANDFEKKFAMKAYFYGIIDKEGVDYQYLAYITNDKERWKREKEELKNGTMFVYITKKYGEGFGRFVPVTFNIENRRLWIIDSFF